MTINDEDPLRQSGTTLVVTVTPPHGEPLRFAYDVSTPSNVIVQDSTSSMKVGLEPEYIETFTESVERSKGLGSGFSVRLGFGKWGYFEVEKKPTNEVRKIQKLIWRKPQSK